MGSGQIVSLDVITNPVYARNLVKQAHSSDSSKSDFSNISCKLFSDSFEMHIKSILSSGTSQPILKLNQSKGVTSKESLELLIYAFQVLRDEHITKHDKVRQEIEKRVKILQLLKSQQQQEIVQLQIDQNQIRANAERLAETYEETNDKQQELIKCLHELIRLLNLKLPRTAMLEKNFGAQIEKIGKATKELSQNIASAKNKMEKQQLQVWNLVNWLYIFVSDAAKVNILEKILFEQIAKNADSQKKKICLQPKQERIIKEAITET